MGSGASRIPGETGRNSAEIKPFVVARPTILVFVTRYRKDEPSWERALICSMLAPQQRDQFAADRCHQRRGMTSTMSTRGGCDVARHFVHAHNVRRAWLSVGAHGIVRRHRPRLG